MWTLPTSMVGRAREWDRLDAALSAAIGGDGGGIVLLGEPGIGKTRLAAEIAGAALDRGAAVLQGRGSTIGPMVPYRPLTQALLSFLRRCTLPDLTELGPYRDILGRLIPDWDTGAPTASSPVVLAEALVRFLTLIGRDRGCVLILDDLQDADAETLAITEYLLDNVAGLPVLVVAAVRAEASLARDLAHAAVQRGAARLLDLPRLDRESVCAFAAASLGVPADRIPEPVTDRLWADSAGLPFIVEELMQDLVGSGRLIRSEGACVVVGDLGTGVPSAITHHVTGRIDRLGPQARHLLSLAAVVGRRFPLPVIRLAAGIDEKTMLAVLHAGVADQLVGPDEPAPEWYSFRHPLTAEVLRGALTPTEHAEYARRAADAVETLHPDLAGEWCPTAAALLKAAGEDVRAGLLFAEAGRRAIGAGAVRSAVNLCERAHELLTTAPVGVRADAAESLLTALGETGDFDRAAQLAELPGLLYGSGLPRQRRAGLHAQLANIAYLAGRWEEAATQIDTARDLLGTDPADRDIAPIDAVAANLHLNRPGPDRLQSATALATRAAAAAERSGLPEVACDAWQLLGILARGRGQDFAEANSYFERARLLADRHGLPIQRVYSHVLQAGLSCLSSGDVTEFERLSEQTRALGMMPVAYEVDAILAMQAVMRGEFDAADAAIADCLGVARRLRLGRVVPYLLVARVILAGHRGDRTGLDAALSELRRCDGDAPYERPLTYGLGRVVCALLEEDRDLAERDLAQAITYEMENPTTLFLLVGDSGLRLLFGALAGRTGWAHHRAVAGTAAGRLRWNWQFLLLTEAVLHGRDGRGDEAAAAMTAARAAGEIYPTAWHLGLRLVAEAALADGWGEPVGWLGTAEGYFHERGVTAVAGACRRLMRGAGVTVRQRRAGTDQVPDPLRRLGVTAREFEVCQLLGLQMGNKSIAGRLHISPRTVEKHVAQLLAKTRQDDRESLTKHVRTLLSAS